MQLENHDMTARRSEAGIGNTFGSGHRSGWLLGQVIAAVDRLDPERLRQLIELEGCTDALEANNPGVARLCAALQRQVKAATQTSDPQKLYTVWQVALPLVNGLPQERVLARSAEQLLFKMQRVDPVGAARMTLETIDQAWSPTTGTNVSTLVAAQSAALSFEDLKLVSDLSKELLDKGCLDLKDPALVDRLNVFLACTCDPKPAHERIGKSYSQELSISDVAWRIQLGAQVADAAVRAGVEFSTPATAKRIDMSIRGIASVGALLRLECALKEGVLTEHAVEQVSKRFGVKFAWMAPDWRREDLQRLYEISEFLLLEAVDIARSCFMEVDEGEQGVRVGVRYDVSGITLSNIILCLCKTELPCKEARCLAVAALLSHALQVPNVTNEVSKEAIHSALKWMDRDEEDPEIRGNAILAVLGYALPQITDAKLLHKLAMRVCEYASAAPEMEATCHSYLDAMSARLDELTKKRERKEGSTWFSDLLKGQ